MRSAAAVLAATRVDALAGGLVGALVVPGHPVLGAGGFAGAIVDARLSRAPPNSAAADASRRDSRLLTRDGLHSHIVT